MGYDPTRFIGEIEEEFLCSICTMVLENPLQSSCEHMFCQLCIKNWLMLDERCPDDRISLSFDQLKLPGRIIRNLLNKLVIKCDFYREGCKKVVMLEHLQDHRDRCEFKTNVPMACDTGCSVNVQAKSLFDNKQAKIEKCVAKLNDIRRKEFADNQKNDMNKLPRKSLETEMQHEPNPIPSTFVNEPKSKWQQLCNLKEPYDDVLEVEDKSIYAFAQLSCAMQPTIDSSSSSFKIKLLSFDYFKYMAIGFTSKGHQIDKIPGLYKVSIGCDSAGDLILDSKSKKVGDQWKVDDVIECGIKFPNDSENAESDDQTAKVYFRRNGETIAETKVVLPNNGYYPTIYMFEGVTGSWWNNGEMHSMEGTNTKVKYFH